MMHQALCQHSSALSTRVTFVSDKSRGSQAAAPAVEECRAVTISAHAPLASSSSNREQTDWTS